MKVAMQLQQIPRDRYGQVNETTPFHIANLLCGDATRQVSKLGVESLKHYSLISSWGFVRFFKSLYDNICHIWIWRDTDKQCFHNSEIGGNYERMELFLVIPNQKISNTEF